MSLQKVTCLTLLDLSAAFNTIDHLILLERLSSWFGITSTALKFLGLNLISVNLSPASVTLSVAPKDPWITAFTTLLFLKLISCMGCSEGATARPLSPLPSLRRGSEGGGTSPQAWLNSIDTAYS